MKNIGMKENMKENIQRIWGESLKSLKSLMQIFAESAESAESANSAKQIFATFATFAMQIFSNLVNFVKLVMQIFHKGSYSAVRVSSVQQPTNFQRISNLSLTMSPVKVAQKSRIPSYLPLLATYPILSRLCLVSLIWMLLMVGGFSTRVWANTVTMTNSHIVTDKKDANYGKAIVSTTHARFTLISDGGSSKIKNEDGLKVLESLGRTTKYLSLTWEKTEDKNYSIKVTGISFRAKAWTSSSANDVYVVFNGVKNATDIAPNEWKGPFGGTNTRGFESISIGFSNEDDNNLVQRTYNCHIENIVITYEIVPATPSVAEGSDDVDVTIDSDDKQTIDVSGFFSLSNPSADFTYEYDCYNQDGGDFEGSNFYSIKAGEFNVRARIVAVANCHINSEWSDDYTITVNRLTPTLTLSGTTGTVDKTNDVESPNTFNLRSLISAYVGDGISYSVSSANSAYAYFSGDNFYATQAGEYTIVITSNEGDQYSSTSREVTITVRDKARPSFEKNYLQTAADALLVEDTIENAFTFTNISNDANFTWNITPVINSINNGNGKVISYDKENNRIIAHNAGTATLQFVQTETGVIYGGSSEVYTFTVSKYETSFTGSAYNLMVDGTQTADYSYTNTSAAQPTANSADDFYYAVENVEFANSALNSGTNLVTFNPDDKLITACNAGTGTITLRQKETYKYTGDTVSYNVAVYKYNSVFSGIADFDDVLVDNSVTSEYVLTYTKPDAGYVGAANHVAGAPAIEGAFRYAVAHDVQTENVVGSPDGSVVIAYNPSTKVATGKNKGVATVTLTQDETYKYNGATTSFNVNVSKQTPIYTFDGKSETTGVFAFTYPFNSEIKPVFSTTSGKEVAYTSVSDSVYTANMVEDSLYVFNVAEIAHITISQPETYKWNAHEKTYTITPEKASNHVPFTYTSAMLSDTAITKKYCNSSSTISWIDNNSHVGLESDWNDWDDKSIVIRIEGIPDKLSFSYRTNSAAVSNSAVAHRQADWFVEESSDGKNYSRVWENLGGDNSNNTSGVLVSNKQLQLNTRYIKFCYSGNYRGYFTNIQVTELHKFATDPTPTLDFGLQGQNYGQQVMTVNFDHMNAGRVTTARIVDVEGDATDDSEYFTVSPTEIAGTGRDIAGSSTLRVTFDNKTASRGKDGHYNAKLVIEDNQGHETILYLTGQRDGKSFPQFTFNPNHMPYYYNTTIHTPVESTNTLAPITIESNDSSIAEVVDGTLVIKKKGEEVTITVSQPDTADFRAHSQTFKFTPREEPPLKLPFIMTKTIYDNNKMVISKGEDVSWTDDGYIRSGWSDWQATAAGRYWDGRKVFVIEFANAPDKLSFTAKNTYCSINCRWKVEQSSDNVNWSQVFYKNQSCKDDVIFSDIQLDPSTRYLRFQYGGNYTGYFKDINVTCLDGYKYMLTPDNKYLSRGADWGTQAIVGEFGVPVRVTRSTTNNTDVYTQVQYMDSREFLYEAGGNLVFTDNKTASNNANIQWKQTVVDGKVIVQSANPGMGGKYITVGADNKFVMTSDSAAATVWEVEDYTIHQARIDAKLDAKAAEAARHDFGAEINTMAKVRTMLQTEEFDSTVVALKPRAISEVKGIYRYEGTTGTKPIFDTVVSGLDTGFYCLTVQAFYRPSVSPRDWENHANGMESHPAYVYANGFKFPIKSVFDETGRHSTQFAGDTLCPDGWYPANLASAVNAMSGDANKYKYWHDLYVYVHADEGQTTGTLRFGVQNPSYVPGTWLVYGNFTLTKLARKMYYFDNEGSQSHIWSTTDDWEYKEGRATSTPGEKNAVTIQSDVEVAGEFKVYSLTVDAGKTVTIDPTGGLTIGVGGVSLGNGAQLILKAETEGANKGQTGYLRISPEYEGAMPSASVELFAEAYYPTGGNAVWQMVGAPIANEGVKAFSVYKKNWVYSWNEAAGDGGDWYNNLAKMKFEPFIGFETTQKTKPAGMTVTYNGRLVAGNEVITKNLAFTDRAHGYNAMANSFAAPIDISQFTSSDFVHAYATIYILNSGTRAQSVAPGEGVDNPGQWIEIPVANAVELATTYGKPLTIPSMQGFFVRDTAAGAQMKFDYSRLVWGVDYSALRATKPLRAPQRGETEDAIGSLQVSLYANGEVDHLYFLEAEKYDAAFENGYDAHKMQGAGMNIFSVEGDDHLAVDATNRLIGTRVGVRTGEETAYTLVFSHVNSEEDMMLWDTEADARVEIREGGMYTFFAEPNSEITGRFVIVEAEAPEIATGVEDVQGDNVQGTKVHKFIKDDKMFILKNGVLYDATGMRVR